MKIIINCILAIKKIGVANAISNRKTNNEEETNQNAYHLTSDQLMRNLGKAIKKPMPHPFSTPPPSSSNNNNSNNRDKIQSNINKNNISPSSPSSNEKLQSNYNKNINSKQISSISSLNAGGIFNSNSTNVSITTRVVTGSTPVVVSSSRMEEPKKGSPSISPDVIANVRVHAEKEEAEAIRWMEAVLWCVKFDIPPSTLSECLKDGVVLCTLINSIKPGLIIRINQSDLENKQKENISNFLIACKSLQVPEKDLCALDDLYYEKNQGKVVKCILSLGKTIQTTVPEYSGPRINEIISHPVQDSESHVKQWIASITGFEMYEEESLIDRLKSGVVLCQLMNKLVPNSINKIELSKLPYKQMENVQQFLLACRKYGLSD